MGVQVSIKVFGNGLYGRRSNNVIGCFIVGQGSELTGPQ